MGKGRTSKGIVQSGVWGLVAFGLVVSPAAADESGIRDGERGLETGWVHRVRVRWRSTMGLEAGIPRDSWYGRGMKYDHDGKYSQAYDAYSKANTEFIGWRSQRPQDARRIRGWILKAQQQRGLSHGIKQSLYYATRYHYYSSWYYRNRLAQQQHEKYLALRAFGLQPKPELLRGALDNYRKTLASRPSQVEARLLFAGLLHEIGQIRQARAEFSRAQPRINKAARSYHGQWMPLAYYYTVTGRYSEALEIVKKLCSSGSWRRRQVLQSNYFDSLRGDQRFEAIVGTP